MNDDDAVGTGTPPLRAWLARLHADGLRPDAVQLLDALWLSQWLPAPAEAAPPVPVDAPAPARTEVTQAPATATSAGTLSINAGREVEIVLRRAPAPAPAPAGVYAHGGAEAGGDALRARAIRVAGATALRDAAAMARALRPLGRRRRSHTRFVLDEAASVERYADTGTLVPVWQPERERFFSATLLVEETLSLPLWRGLARELETLLARQGGFRRFRRLALADIGQRLHLRSRSGALHPPRTLLDDDAALVLVATDGTTGAWADGRMAAMLAELGARSPLALLQWLPERLWPNTALGGAPLQGALPRAGAPNAELRVARPRWLRGNAAFVAVPLVPLTPPGFARLAATLMGRPGARTPAALLWQAPVPTPRTAAAPESPPADAAARIARFRGVASARVLQTAVQLSAAAPLTLPVIRLVHRVMQPDAPAGDLPLLLLGGLLERCAPPPPAPGATRRRPDDGEDDELLFDFAPGVREALQASLLKPEADAVRDAVSRYIAERSGSPVDFSALLLDPEGALTLPGWARPFAEVTREVQALFEPPPSSAATDNGERLRETAWAPGVTVQAEHTLPGIARELAWAPDGRTLALRHPEGLQLLRPVDAFGGPRSFERLPTALAASPHLVVIKGSGLADGPMESMLAALRTGLAAAFRGAWRFTYHTVDAAFTRPGGRAPARDVRQALQLAAKPRALLVFIGDTAFAASAWMREARLQVERTFALDEAPIVVTCTASEPLATTVDRTSWHMRSLDDRRLDLRIGRARAEHAGHALAEGLADAGREALPEVAFGAEVCAIAWNHSGDLLVADAARRLVRRERDLHQYAGFTDTIGRDERPAITAHPRERETAVVGRSRLVVLRPDARPREAFLRAGPFAPQAAWSPDGRWLAWRDARGAHGLWRQGDAEAWPEGSLAVAVNTGPAWSARGEACAFGTEDGEVLAWPAAELPDEPTLVPLAAQPGAVQALAFSPVDGLLAVARADGRIAIGRWRDNVWTEPFAIEAPEPRDADEPILLGFMPATSEDGDGFETLAVAQGERLWLLRIDAARLVFTPAEAPASTPAEAPAAAGNAPPEAVDAPPPGPGTVDAACAVLQALALAFHVGAFALPRSDGLPRDRYARRLGAEAGTPAHATLTHLVGRSEYIFTGELKSVLDGNSPDPLAAPDATAGLALLQREMDALGEALSTLASAASRPRVGDPGPHDEDREDAHRALRQLQRWLALAGRIVDDLDDVQAREAAAATGFDLRGFLASLAPLGQPGLLALDPALTARQPLLSALQSALPALRSPALWSVLAPAAARAGWLHAQEGPSAFLGSHSIADYADRLVGALGEAAASLLSAPGAPATLQVDFPTPLPALRHVIALADAAGLPIGLPAATTPPSLFPDTASGWTVPATAVPPLIRLLGGVVATALARRTGAPLPAEWAAPGLRLLWVDDETTHNARHVRRLAQRGFFVETATDTDGALSRLSSSPPIAAVITDMGRPPDPRAGYTLLDAMRARGDARPLLIFSQGQNERTRAEAASRGAAVSSENFDEIEATLRDQLRFLVGPA